jgi:hypothetical protein
MNRGPEKVGRFLGAMVVLALCLLLSSCSSYRLATVSDDMYPVDYVIPVSNETKIDTIDSYFKLKYKLRTDFNFRWDFAQYAIQQPYSWYWSNPRLESFWRPFNRFDVYFYSNWFWNDWAFNYPYNSYWGWNSWHNYHRPWYYRPYNWGYSWYDGPWNNPGYNVVWNSSRRNNIANVIGPRGSRTNSIIPRDNNNIENTIVRRYNKPRNNVINNIVDELRENFNVKPRVYNNPNNVPNNGRPIINNNNSKPIWNNSRPINNNNLNSNSIIRNNNSFSSPPPSSNISRGSSTSSGGSSRGGNSRGNN